MLLSTLGLPVSHLLPPPPQGASLPVMDLTELPKCTVCLERMDESVNGVLTTLCNHSFHSQCLQWWEDTS